MTLDPREWHGPQWLLFGLSLVLVVTAIVGLSTGSAAFGVYNSAWDGASSLNDVASETGAESTVALNTTIYERVDPTTTVVVILSPSQPYTPAERQRIADFVDRGGTLVIAEDYGAVGNSVLRTLGAETRFDGRVLRDERNYGQAPVLPVATNTSDRLEQRGVAQLTLNYGTVLESTPTENGSVSVRTSEFAYLDTDRDGTLDQNESLRAYPVVTRESVGNGTVISVSDPSLFINAMLEAPDNEAFVQTLFENQDRVVLDYSGFERQPPLSVGLLWLRRTPLLQAGLVLFGVVAVIVGSRRHRLLERLPEWGRPTPQEPSDAAVVDRDDLRRVLSERHPEWDGDRLDRVITGILTRRESGDDDD